VQEIVSMWLLPALVLVTVVLVSIPLSRYMARSSPRSRSRPA